ncbi:hypothetical protein CsSME_00043052 [Camellia sinensis var. sinensis]
MAQQQTRRERLKAAAEAGKIDGLYDCIKDDPHILDGIDKIPFVDTPLHIAASAGHAHFALEMMRLMPSFSKKLNPQGLSPLDLALRKRADLRRNLEDLNLPNREELSKLQKELTQTIRQLINFDKELIRVKGRESFTPLHYVAEKGDIDLLAEFLLACPESIMDRTIRDETAVHIAVKNSKLEACKVLLGWLRRSLNQKLLNSKDDTGNTALHIAVSNSQTEIVKLLAEESYTNKNATNLDGLMALDIAARSESEREIEVILRCAGALKSSSSPTHYSHAGFLKSPERMIEKIIKKIFHMRDFFSMSMETRNVILVVAVLVATATFQAILSPPGGLRGLGGDNNNQPNGTLINATIISTTGLPTNISNFNVTVFTTPSNTSTTHNPANQVLYHDASFNSDFTYGSFFIVFYVFNTLCFFLSIATIISVLPIRFHSILLSLTLMFLIFSYGYSFYVISPSFSIAQYFMSVSRGCTAKSGMSGNEPGKFWATGPGSHMRRVRPHVRGRASYRGLHTA